MAHILYENIANAPGRGEITDPDIIEALTMPSESTFAELRRIQEAHAVALMEMRKHPERYLVD